MERGTDGLDRTVGAVLRREGLDLPEVSLVAILDADKEGFLRSERSLIQTIGRAARHINGKAILYADRVTNSMTRAIGETDRRRNKQIAHNLKMGITPIGIVKTVRDMIDGVYDAQEAQTQRRAAQSEAAYQAMSEKELTREIKSVERGDPVFEAQLLAYLKASGKRIGLLINFNVPRLMEGVKRRINPKAEAAAD